MEASVFKRILKILPAVCLATGIAWAAESPFIGEWKLDPSNSRMPDEMKVQSKGGNQYTFDFGVGPETIVVDGSDQQMCIRDRFSPARLIDMLVAEKTPHQLRWCCSEELVTRYGKDFGIETDMPASLQTTLLAEAAAWAVSSGAQYRDCLLYTSRCV